jgi:hypothetical protein
MTAFRNLLRRWLKQLKERYTHQEAWEHYYREGPQPLFPSPMSSYSKGGGNPDVP